MKVSLVRPVCTSLLWRGLLLGKSPGYLQAKSNSDQAGGLGMKALLESRCEYIRARHWVDVHLECSQMSPLQRLICPGKLPVRSLGRSAFFACLIVLSIWDARNGFAQFSIPGLSGKSGQSNDKKADQLLHQHLPLVLDANNAYPTVPDQNMLGGPFHPRTLPITLDTLTKPLPPGDYVLPMTFFCSEYSVHRGGNGIAYQLGPAQGTAAKAISNLLWRGMLTGHKPQELQSVSWAIQGSVAYDKMPPKYRALVDQLIPDMKNQVNGQAFADIEDGFQGKLNRVTKRLSGGISKGTGGFVHADIKVDVELNESFQRLGQVGRSALDGEKLNTIFTAAFPSDQAREQALYAGQGQQSAALPAANGPWSVKVPGVAYMRFVVHGGNLQGDNMMQIRILPPRASQAMVDERPHLVLAGYEQTQQSTPSSPSVISLFNGSVNETALSQCQAIPVNQQMCMAQAITVSGDTGYSIGTGAQAPIMAPAQSLPTAPQQPQICVKKLIYQPTLNITYPHDKRNNDQPNSATAENIGLCIFLGAITADGDSCKDASPVDIPAGNVEFNWVQTYITNGDTNGCTINEPHKDECKNNRKVNGIPLYRTPTENNLFNSNGSDFHWWVQASTPSLKLLFRDIPQRRLVGNGRLNILWHTAEDMESKGPLDNNLRFVTLPDASDSVNYTPSVEIKYGFHINPVMQTVTVEPLYIAGQQVDSGGTESISHLRELYKAGELPLACTIPDGRLLSVPKLGHSDSLLNLPTQFIYEKP